LLASVAIVGTAATAAAGKLGILVVVEASCLAEELRKAMMLYATQEEPLAVAAHKR